MKSKRRSPIWPYLAILACLFVLSVTAPRAWERMGRKSAPNPLFYSHKTPAEESAADASEEFETAPAAELAPRESIEQRPAVQPIIASARMVEPAWETASPAPPSEPTPAVDPPPSVPMPAPVEQAPVEQAPLDDVPVEQTPTSIAPPAEAPFIDTPSPATSIAEPSRPVAEVANRPRHVADEPTRSAVAADEAPIATKSPEPPAAIWPIPSVLVEQLTVLSHEEPASLWARQAIELIHQVCQSADENRAAAEEAAGDLRRLLTRPAATATVEAQLESQITRARYGLTRWLDVWQSASGLDDAAPQTLTADRSSTANAKAGNMRICLADAEAIARRATPGGGWSKYLQLDELARLARDGQSDEARRRAARTVLDRLTSPRLTRSQRKFVTSGPLAALQVELRAWAAEPVMARRLLTHLEQYERTGLASDAWEVANDFRGLQWWSPAEAEDVSRQLDTHYRNANVRVALTGALLNRIVPQPDAIAAPVNDVVVNVPVHGCSTTFTKLTVIPVPDPKRIRIGLEANGVVSSNTTSTSGPATFHNEGQSAFLVRKLFVLGPQGLTVWPAVAEAENKYNYLISLETDFDSVPLVGPLVRNIARSQHDEAIDEASAEVAQKVALRARSQLDEELKPRLEKAANDIQKKQLATLERLGLELTPIELSTTEERIVARARLGSPEQLGAHTPRPRAPSDSWLSVQIHQSALNNGLEQLKLDGRQFDLPSLFKYLAERLDRPEIAKADDVPDDVRMKFAAKDAVRLKCDGDRVEVTFAFAELTDARNRWRDFTVRTTYRPEPDDHDPRFVREDTIHLDGRSVRGKPNIALRAIFSRVLSKNRDISLLNKAMTDGDRLEGLEITQFVVEDGWIGLAYSPRRGPSHVAHQPK